MRTLVFDVETTGLINTKKARNYKLQPRIVQLAAALVETGVVRSKISLIVDPGIPVPEVVTKVHGIDNAAVQRYGVSPIVAISMFNNLLKVSDRLCAHNAKFDLIVMHAEYLRAERNPERLLSLPTICTMKTATPLCKLPPTAKMIAAGKKYPKFKKEFKSPKLEEAVSNLLKWDIVGAHDAMVDVEATVELLQYLESAELEKMVEIKL